MPAARLLGKPTVVHINTSTYTRYCYNSNFLKRADLAITVSDKVREGVLEHADVKPERVVTVYDGIQTEKSRQRFTIPRAAEELERLYRRVLRR